jgi:radical SAM protein with 4Fe4S-binding SPASM domain
MIEYAFDSGNFKSIDLTTNGLLLTKEMVKQLIGRGLDKIVISVPHNYTKEYIDNIAFAFRFLTSHIHCKIIAEGLTETQIGQFYLDFGDICDTIFVEHQSPCWPGYVYNEPSSSVGIYGNPIQNVQVCPYIFYSIAINSNGTVSLCFLDWQHKNLIGYLGDETVVDVWNGLKLSRNRILQLEGGRKAHKFCGQCKQLEYCLPDDIDQYKGELLDKLMHR